MLEIHIRHGQSSHSSPYDLTEKGQKEARIAGEYLHSHFPEGFEVGLHSGSLRAKQTAELLGYPSSNWKADRRLGELRWGEHTPVDLPALMKSSEYLTIT
jgi:broad specificity phosphatase PhoE